MTGTRQSSGRPGLAVALAGMVYVLVALVALGCATGASAAGDEGRVPSLELSAEGALSITGLPPVLGDEEVRRALDSGLTTTFQFRLELRRGNGERVRGGAIVEIRYEPWDEVYHLVAIGIDARATRHVEPSFEALGKRWRELRLLLLRPKDSRLGGESPRPASPRLFLEVIPFSRGEQRDAQRWLAESLDRTDEGSAASASDASEERTEALSEAFQLLLATSIQRHAILSYDWRPTIATRRATREPSP